MIQGLIDDAWRKARLQTGLAPGVVVWGMIAMVCSGATLLFLCIAAFVFLTNRYDTVTAGLILAGFFLLVTLIALTACLLTRRQAVERARAELTLAHAARGQASAASWFDPKMLAIGLQLVQTVGFKRILPIAAAGFLALEIGKEWIARPKPENGPKTEPPK